MQGEPLPTGRFDVLGVPVSALTRASAVDRIDMWIRERTPRYVCVTGVHGVVESLHDDELRRIHDAAGMVTPDGMPLVWLARARGLRFVERVYGPDLMLDCCDSGVGRGYRHFLYGGAPGIAERLAERLSRRFPGLIVAGVCSPPYRELTADEDEALVHSINTARPDIVWVGLGTPKQERWMAAHVGRLEAAALVGVGAAFDFHAGVKPQAPKWMQRSGLEWSFRLATEPRRLFRRYAANNSLFIWKLAVETLVGPARQGV